jgi:hypothetical protein
MKNGALWALLGVGGLLALAASSGTANASTGDPYAVPPGGGSNPRIVWSSALPDGGRVELWDDAGYQVVVATDAAGNTVFTGTVADFERWSNARYPGTGGTGGTGGGNTYVPPPPAPGGGTGRDEVIHTTQLAGGVTAYQTRLRDGSEWWAVLNQSDGHQIFGGSRAEYERWLSSWIASQPGPGTGGSTGGGSTGGGSTGGGGSHTSEPHDRDTVEAYQRILRALQYQIAADGVIGPATRTALRAFQGAANRERGWHLAVDGVLGPNTRNALAWYLGRGYFDDAGISDARVGALHGRVLSTSSPSGLQGLEGLERRF